MRNQLLVLFTVAGLLTCSLSIAQSYVGHSIDNYSGLQGLLFNPASVVDSKQRADINLFSTSVFGGSDYFSTDLNAIFESEDGFTFEENVERTPSDQNQFFLNVDALGPSFMFNLNRRSSIAVTSRMRGFMNFNNINGTLYESIEEDFDVNENFDFQMQNFSGTLHVWGEVGLTYGRILLDNNRSFLKGGVTLKYLQGFGATFMDASVTGEYNVTNEFLTSTGGLSYGSSPNFDSEDIDFENLSTGFGGDIGFVYELRTPRSMDDPGNRHSDYKLKLGVSVTDIGSISYADSEVTSYDLNNTITSDSFEGRDFDQVLEEEYQGTEEIVESKINLPTAMHLLVDYNIRNSLFVSLQGSMSLVDENQEQANRIINTVTATPRLETRWFSMYLPISLRQYDGLAMGAGFRLGPLTIGSGSIITNYLTDSSKTVDLYAGLKIPIYR